MILTTNYSNQKTEIIEILQVKILVLALGESQHYGWWRSQFLSTTGLSFLDRIYPRTKFVAAVHSASRAAQQIHDAGIGKGKISHLFRLNANIEDELNQLMRENEKELLDHFLPVLNEKQRLIEDLGNLTNGTTGPKQVGPVLLSADITSQIKLVAAIYLNGFQQNVPVFPYFKSQE